jgi:signal transduction histidine kinase
MDDSDVTNTMIANYHPPETAGMIINEAIPAAARDGTWSGETVLLTTEGREIPVSQVIIAHRDVDGTLEYVSTILRDISERRQAEQQRLKLALEQEQHTAFKEFLGTISHDLKTPMTVVHTSLELLERIDDPERRKEKIGNIRREMTLLQQYIEDLLLLTRLDRVPDQSFSALDLNPILIEIHSHVIATAEAKGVALTTQLGAQLPTILGDKRDIYRALTNLIENAVHYTHSGGSVTVTTRSDDVDVIIEVADTGIGIDPAEIAPIFERFYRSIHAQQMRSGGTGLGLAIVKRIVEVHAGTVEVESTPGVGSTFRVRLPLASLMIKASG